ncbi:MAG: transglycosylase SLT domain-containing protein [Pseudomonadota bacterium]
MAIDALSAVKQDESSNVSVANVIKRAAKQTGLDFDLMLGVAKRESSLRPDAKAATSSASGLFQFIDQTWLGAVKQHGEELGLGAYAKDIQRTGDKFTVADPARRDEVLNLRFNPRVAAQIAGKTLGAAKDRLTASLGREATSSEVYMAHFLGERGAQRMLAAGEAATAADIDPRAAKANQTLFFQNGRALTVSEFKDKLALHLGTESQAPKVPAQPVLGPYRPVQPVKVETYASPSPARFVGGLPPQLQAAIVEMQSDFIFGRDDT